MSSIKDIEMLMNYKKNMKNKENKMRLIESKIIMIIMSMKLIMEDGAFGIRW